jgi:hypothetical protein
MTVDGRAKSELQTKLAPSVMDFCARKEASNQPTCTIIRKRNPRAPKKRQTENTAEHAMTDSNLNALKTEKAGCS